MPRSRSHEFPLGGLILYLSIVGLGFLVIRAGQNFWFDWQDTQGLPLINGQGTVEAHYYQAAWTQPIVISTGRTTTVSIINHPAQYDIRVSYEGWVQTIPISRSYYEAHADGSRIPIYYQVGRSGTHYLRYVH